MLVVLYLARVWWSIETQRVTKTHSGSEIVFATSKGNVRRVFPVLCTLLWNVALISFLGRLAVFVCYRLQSFLHLGNI